MQSRISLALVDDDQNFLFEICQKLQSRGFEVHPFRDAQSLLLRLAKGRLFDCIVADVRLPALSGLDLQFTLTRERIAIPLILITGFADIEVAVSAMKAGAADFIGKPIDEARLVASIERAVEESHRRMKDTSESASIAARVAKLSDRHRQVLDLVVKGLTSKQIAVALNINYRTVENYRAIVMEEIGVSNIAQLVRVMLQVRGHLAETGREKRQDDEASPPRDVFPNREPR